MNSIEKIGKIIKKKRLDNSLSYSDLSKICQIDINQLKKIENGKINDIEFLVILKIIESLG